MQQYSINNYHRTVQYCIHRTRYTVQYSTVALLYLYPGNVQYRYITVLVRYCYSSLRRVACCCCALRGKAPTAAVAAAPGLTTELPIETMKERPLWVDWLLPPPLLPVLLLLLLLLLLLGAPPFAGSTPLRGTAPARTDNELPTHTQLALLCRSHKSQFDLQARSRLQLVVDIFFAGLGKAILPGFGSLLGVVRHRLLCAPWDDDLDFTIDTAAYDALFYRADDKPLRFAGSSSVEDITNSPLGALLVEHTQESKRCVEGCNKLFVLRVSDPGDGGSTGAAAANRPVLDTLVHSYFTRNPGENGQVCLSLAFLNYGFVKVMAHSRCSLDEPRHAITDLFPQSYTWDKTCPTQDYLAGVPNSRCVSHALFAQPNITATAGMRTVSGDVELLVPNNYFARMWLSGEYGSGWSSEAIICGHAAFSDYDVCRKSQKPVALDQLRALMGLIPDCLGLEGTDAGKKEVVAVKGAVDALAGMALAGMSATSTLRSEVYLRVATKYLEGRDRWEPIYYLHYPDNRHKNVRNTKRLPTDGSVARANLVLQQWHRAAEPLFFDESRRGLTMTPL